MRSLPASSTAAPCSARPPCPAASTTSGGTWKPSSATLPTTLIASPTAFCTSATRALRATRATQRAGSPRRRLFSTNLAMAPWPMRANSRVIASCLSPYRRSSERLSKGAQCRHIDLDDGRPRRSQGGRQGLVERHDAVDAFVRETDRGGELGEIGGDEIGIGAAA